MDNLKLVEDEDYHLRDVPQVVSNGTKYTKVYRREAPSPQATEKLIEYGIVTSNRSSTIKKKLDNLKLVEDEDYSLLLDVQQQ